MAQMLLSYLVLYGIRSNVIILNGSGALVLQREKMYRSFRYLDAILVILGTVVISIITYILNTYVYAKLNLYYINFSVVVFMVGLYNLFVSYLWRKVSNFQNYLYQKSYSYAIDVAFMLSVILTLNMSLPMADFLVSLVAISAVIFVSNMLVGFYVHSINRGYMNINFRDVSARLFILAIFSILVFYVGQLII